VFDQIYYHTDELRVENGRRSIQLPSNSIDYREKDSISNSVTKEAAIDQHRAVKNLDFGAVGPNS